MPQRTNSFQDFITSIYRASEHAEDASITPSAMVHDPDIEQDREIDILIEKKSATATFHIAIECRSHRRVQNVEWIDSLVGKYANNEVPTKLVAVSKSGFSKSALKKASAHGIEALTLEEANKSNVPGLLSTIHEFTFVKYSQPTLIGVKPHWETMYRKPRSGLMRTITVHNESVGCNKQSLEKLVRGWLQKDDFKSELKRKAIHSATSNQSLLCKLDPYLYVQDSAGTAGLMKAMELVFDGRSRNFVTTPLKSMKLGSLYIGHAELQIDEDNVRVTLTQKNDDDEVKGIIEKTRDMT